MYNVKASFYLNMNEIDNSRPYGTPTRQSRITESLVADMVREGHMLGKKDIELVLRVYIMLKFF